MARQLTVWSVLAGLLAVTQLGLFSVDRAAASVAVEPTLQETTQLAQLPALETIVVDALHALAADTNPGTAAAPLVTIGRALQLAEVKNRLGVGSRIVVGPGTYRETVSLRPGGQSTEAPLLIEGSGPGSTIVAGSDVWTGWTQRGDTLEREWPHTWGVTPLPNGWQDFWDQQGVSPVVQRREQIFADGQQLRQVLTREELQATPGSFIIDEGAQTVTVRLPAGVDPDRVRLEVATRPHLFQSNGWNNVTVRGITFQHAVNGIQQHAVVVDNSRNVLIDNSEVLWGNWSGLGIIWSEDVTVRNTRMNSNGAVGFIVYQSRNLVFEGSENSYNNWRGEWGNFRNWEDGSKVWGVRGMVVRNHTAVHNNSYGLWFDYDNADVRVEDSFLAHNALTGLFLEASQGPFMVRNNVICDNQRWGVKDGKSAQVTLQGNHIFNNGHTQLIHTGRQGAREVTAWDTGTRLQVHSENWTLRDNVIAGATAAQQLVWITTDVTDWSRLRATRTSANNLFHSPAAPEAFRLTDGRTVTFPVWQQESGQDATSRSAAPTQPLRCEPGHLPEAPPEVETTPDTSDDPDAEPQPLTGRFTDVTGGPHLPTVEAIARRGITQGCRDDLFCPNDLVTRGQMAAFLVRALELPPAEDGFFGDVVGSSHEAAINSLAAAGITGGCADGRFCPAAPVTRAQMGSFLQRAFELLPSEGDRFDDVSGTSAHRPAINAIAEAGITLGCAERRYCPQHSVRRSEMASFLARALSLV